MAVYRDWGGTPRKPTPLPSKNEILRQRRAALSRAPAAKATLRLLCMRCRRVQVERFRLCQECRRAENARVRDRRLRQKQKLGKIEGEQEGLCSGKES